MRRFSRRGPGVAARFEDILVGLGAGESLRSLPLQRRSRGLRRGRQRRRPDARYRARALGQEERLRSRFLPAPMARSAQPAPPVRGAEAVRPPARLPVRAARERAARAASPGRRAPRGGPLPRQERVRARSVARCARAARRAPPEPHVAPTPPAVRARTRFSAQRISRSVPPEAPGPREAAVALPARSARGRTGGAMGSIVAGDTAGGESILFTSSGALGFKRGNVSPDGGGAGADSVARRGGAGAGFVAAPAGCARLEPGVLISIPGARRNSGPGSGAGGRSVTSSGPHHASSRRAPPVGFPNSTISSRCSSIDNTTNWYNVGGSTATVRYLARSALRRRVTGTELLRGRKRVRVRKHTASAGARRRRCIGLT